MVYNRQAGLALIYYTLYIWENLLILKFNWGKMMNTLELTNKDMTVSSPVKECTVYKMPEVVPEKKIVFEGVKRGFDICASLVALLILFIPLIAISLLIILDSPGGAVFKQERLGKNGKPFMLYKFRTMHADAEKDGAKWAEKNDERCTRLGKYLRASRIDEFPQLINILKGDMSIVGPRPERECFYEEFEQYINGFKQRLCITPGLTGLAQINGGYDLKPEEKIVYDLEYVEKRNILLDLKIIFKTVAVVFDHKGAR